MDRKPIRPGLGEEAERPEPPGGTIASWVPGFLRQAKEAILSSWESRVTSEGHEVALKSLALRDDIPGLLDELETWLASDAAPERSMVATSAFAHVMQRLDQGLLLGQVLREYRLLRETILEEVLRAEVAEQDRAGATDEAGRGARIRDLARLNAGLDVVLSQSIEQFVAERDRRAEAERARAAQAMRESEIEYRALFESVDEGFCIVEVLFEGERAVDYRFVRVNPAFERHTGLQDANGKRVREMVPGVEEHWVETFGRVARTGEPTRFEDVSRVPGCVYDVYAFRVGAPEDHQVGVLLNDITKRKHAEVALRAQEARQAFLLRLSDTLQPLADAVEVQAAAARLLRHHLGASRVHYADAEPDGKHVVVSEDHASGVPDRAGRYALADFPGVTEEMRAGRTVVVADVTGDSRIGPEERARYLALPVAALVLVPIRKQEQLAALLAVHRDRAHVWSPGEVKLIEETAARTYDAVLRARAEQALRASEERYRQALESMSEGHAILSRDWTYLFVNKVNAEQAHSRPEDMLGRSLFEVIPGVERSPFFEAYRRCMEERTPQHVESAFTYEDGSSAWFEAVAQPIAEGILVRAQDITARKRDEYALRESEELVRTIAENSTQALVMMDGAGYCTYWNPALVAMTGYTAEELRSKPLHDLIHHHHPDGRPYPMAECPIDRALPENFDVRAHEDLFFRKDGTPFPVLCAASPIVKGGESVGTVVEVRDITERKRAEEALREADRRKDHFLAVLSHELRNPLAPIKNGLYILDRAPAGGDQARRARAVIERQVDQLTRLVDDLLDVTRITRGKIQLQRQRLELGDLVRRTLEDHRSLLEKAELDLRVEPLPERVFIDADWNRIAQAIGNLLLNAAKFTAPGGHVTVALSVDASARQAVLRVSDTGAGIAPEILPQLFEPFVQADATLDRSKGGLGLGLALVKGLIEQHGGSVSATSEGLGRGAEFTVRLPLVAVVQPQRDAASAGVPKMQRRVLVIEDNKDAADTLREVLEMDGHEVAVAYSGPEGIAKAREFHPDLVLCDIGLPAMDGYTVARLFRADEELKHAHLVALSGYALPEDLQRAAEAGFERHIAKPPTREKLEKVVREVR